MNPAAAPADILPSIADLLRLNSLTLATCGPDSAPHAAPVYFAASESLRLYFFSDPTSRHAQDLALNPQAGAAIYPECANWQEIRGLQMRGVVQALPPGVEWQQGWHSYLGKFPFVASLGALLAQNSLYVFIPAWVRYLDNRRGFGFKQEWMLE